MDTPKPAPTSAPTEQDRATARAISHEFSHTGADYEDLESLIAAALQAERERTRAEDMATVKEIGDKAIGVFSSYPMVEATVASIVAALEAATARKG